MSESLLESTSKNTTESVWQLSGFRQKFIIVCIALVIVFASMPTGFNFIQQRHGQLLDDFVLNFLPAIDFSIPIFVIIYGLTAWLVFRAYQDPRIVLNFGAGYVLVTLCRFITITSFPLEPPIQLVDLVDPITGIFYGGQPITRDLFFSGHTSSVFLIYLSLYTKPERSIALWGTIVLGIMLLFQHIHYTIDVVVAFPATYLLFWLGKKWTKF
jgi:hypothetical protein